MEKKKKKKKKEKKEIICVELEKSHQMTKYVF